MKPNIKHLCLFAALGGAFWMQPSPALAETPDAARTEAKLAAVRSHIAALTQRLASELKQRDTLHARLREADLGIAAAQKRLEGLHAAAREAAGRRDVLRTVAARLKREIAAQRSALAAQARSAYENGGLEPLKLLLSQDDPASVGRMAAYYGYFAQQRFEGIAAVDRQLATFQALDAQLDETAAKLQVLQGDTTREVASLQSARKERAIALAATTQRVSSGDEELDRLKREEQSEEALLADLAQVLQNYPTDSQSSFGALRGKLSWPVPGRLDVPVGGDRSGSLPGPRRNGVLIETTRGAKVRAPYFGRVIYADWLQGLGLLIIIGHTGNYMTLYGNAEVLYKSVGDWVAPGDVIAGVSESRAAAPQLYFEIRDGRTSVDPKAWLKPTP